MRIVQLQAENFKRLKVVRIDPKTNLVKIGGKNGSGKSSALDAIYVALVGRSGNPPRPVRAGEDKATIKLDLGEIVITRTFTVKDGDKYTDTLKVETADGLRYGEPQKVLDALLGEIGFDPFEFMQMKPKDQAATLLGMVPLSVDLDELAEQDTSDFAKRRDVNRDVDALEARVSAIAREEVPDEAPDRAALTDQLARAADTNGAILREQRARDDRANTLELRRETAALRQREANEARERAKALDDEAAKIDEECDAEEAALNGLPALDERIDTEALRLQLTEADATLAAIERQRQRADLVEQLEARRKESKDYTAAIDIRARQRNDALSRARMPVEGLGFSIDEAGKAFVTWEGLPFVEDQISTAVQLRVSTAIAMAANPKLRVLRIKDGSLLDEDSIKMLDEMIAAEDYQLIMEVVSCDESVGFIMEDGEVRGGPAPEPKPDQPAKKTPAKKTAAKGAETLL